MNPTFAQSTPRPMQSGDAGYDVVLEAARAPLRDVLGDRVELEVERMDRVGDWAFVLGSMRAPSGGRPDFSGTRFADAAGQGGMSDVYVVLLKREPGDGEAGSGAGTGRAAATAAGAVAAADAGTAGANAGAAGADPAASPAAPAKAAARDQAGTAAAAVGSDAPGGAGDGAAGIGTDDENGFPTGGTWRVLDHAIGPGDVAWLSWPQEHAAPRALFGF